MNHEKAAQMKNHANNCCRDEFQDLIELVVLFTCLYQGGT